MRRSVLVTIILTAGILVCAARGARAQEEEPRWEVGAHYTAIGFNNGSRPVGAPPAADESDSYPTASGFGGRVAYNINSHVAVEAEVNHFPRDRFLEGGRKWQGLFGVRVGKRYERVGVYAKARPGFLHLSRGDFRPRPGVFCPSEFPGCLASEPTTNFAFDAGGVVELFPSRHTFVRFDAGDTMVRLRPRFAPQSFVGGGGVFIILVEGETTHNFQGGVGFGFRF